jgi:hypothetical protein
LTVVGPRDDVSVSEKLLVLSRIVENAERRVSEVAQESRSSSKVAIPPVFPAQSEPAATPA